MKPNFYPFASVKKVISAPINKNSSTSTGRWKWMITVITAVVLMVGLEKPVMALTYTWAGGASGSWALSTNWTGGVAGKTPGNAATDVASFPNTSASYSVLAVPTITIGQIVVTTGGSNPSVTLTPTTTNTLTISAANGYAVGKSCSLTISTGLTIAITNANSFNQNQGTTSGSGTILLNIKNISFPGGNAINPGIFNAANPPNVIVNDNIAGASVSASVTVANLSIGQTTETNTASLTLGGSGINITVKGTFSNYGTGSAGLIGGGSTGAIIFDGASQTFPHGAGSGGVFNTTPNVTITNGIAVSLDASASVGSLSIGTSANGTTGLTLNSGNTVTVNGTFSNFGTTVGLVGPGTISFAASTSFPGSGVFSSTTPPNVTLVNASSGTNTATNNVSVTVNNLSISGTKARVLLSNGANLTVKGTFANSGSTFNDGLVGATGGTIIFNGTSQTFPVGTGSGGIFTNNPNVTIATGVTVTADAAVSINTLTINSTSIFKDGGHAVSVFGPVVNSGAHTSSAGGSITLASSTAYPGQPLSGGGSYGNLTLAATGYGAYLNSNATINGALTLTSGILDPGWGGDTVFISSTGSVAQTGGWVYGFLARYFATSGSAVSQTFQVGDSATSYRPVTVSLSSVSAPGYVIASNTSAIFSPQPTTVAQDVPAYWTLINHVVAYPSATVTLNYLASDVIGSGTYEAQTYVVDNQNANYNTWLSPWTTATFTGTSTTASGVTTFGDFATGETGQTVLIRAGGPLSFCPGGSVALQSTIIQAGPYTYSWYQVPSTSLGITTTNYTANASGQYYLQVQNTSTLAIYYSDTLTVTLFALPTANAGSPVAGVCQGGTTAALGGSFGGNATGAVWSSSGTGTFANNTGSTPGTATYTASASDPSSVTLTLTASGGSCGTANNSKTQTVNPLPVATISFNSPAIICEGAPVVLTSTPAGTYTYQWLLNGSSVGGNTSQYAAATAGAYTLALTNSATGCVGAAPSAAVHVAELPQITVDTIFIACNYNLADTFISLTMPTLSSYSVTPAGCNVNMTGATVITSSVGTGGDVVDIICNGGIVTGEGGSCTFLVEDGGVLDGFAGSGAETAYIKAGGTFNYNGNGTPGGTTVYYEPGAIITNGFGAYSAVQCPTSIGVVYSTGTSDLCTPYTYRWSTGDTSASITVTALTTATYYVTVFQGDTSSNAYCTDSVVVAKLPSPTPTFTTSPGATACLNTNVTYTTQSGQSNYIWTVSGILNTDYSIISGGIGTTSNSATLQWLTEGSKTVTVNYNNVYGCDALSPASTTATISDCWVGGNNGNDWSTASNWTSNSVQNGCAYSVTLPINGNDPVVNSAVSVGNVTITGSGRELITLNNTLSVCGNWTDNSGASSSVSGNQAILNGSSAQTLSGNLTFDQLVVGNTNGGVSLANGNGTTVGINTSLTLQSGSFDATNGVVTLNSTSVTQAAIIDNFSNISYTGTYTGSVTAQRYYAAPTTANSYNQHEIGSPVNTPALSQFGASGTPGYVTDFNCDQTKLDLTSPYGTVFGYDETHGSACAIQQWEVLTSGNATNGVGYSIRSGGPGTLSLTGAPNITGNVTVNGTNSGWTNYTLQGTYEIAGWTLASNPYPATLQISSTSLEDNVAAGWDGSGVMVWNTTGGSAGSYQLTTTLAPFQAFMVHITEAGTKSSPTSATYTIYATDRVTSANTFYKDAAASTLNITATNQSTHLMDLTTVGFNPSATSGFDPNFDVHKIPGDLDRHSLYTVSNGNWMYQNINPSIEQIPTVPMGFSPGVSGTYSLSFDGVNSFDATSYITLEDKQLNIFHDVRSGDYVFTADANDGWNRFVLHFTPPAIILTQDAGCEQAGMINIEQPGMANWNYTLTDINNLTVASGTLNAGAPVSVSVNVGVYTLTLTDNTGYTVVKTVQVQGSQPVIAAFTASATTTQVSDNIVFTSTSANASTYSWDFGDGTTGSGQQASHSYQSPGIYMAKLLVNDGNGCVSSTSQTITVVSRSVTGISNLTGNNLNIWSYENTVFVDFSKVDNVNAEVQLYNVLGQLLSDEKFGKSTLYSKELTNLDVAYIIVKVINDDQITTKKVFIANVSK